MQVSIQWVSGGVLRCCFSNKLLDNVDTAGPQSTLRGSRMEVTMEKALAASSSVQKKKDKTRISSSLSFPLSHSSTRD